MECLLVQSMNAVASRYCGRWVNTFQCLFQKVWCKNVIQGFAVTSANQQALRQSERPPGIIDNSSGS